MYIAVITTLFFHPFFVIYYNNQTKIAFGSRAIDVKFSDTGSTLEYETLSNIGFLSSSNKHIIPYRIVWVVGWYLHTLKLIN